MPAAESTRRPSTIRRTSAAVTIAVAVAGLTGCTDSTTSREERGDVYNGDLTTLVLQFDDSGAKQIGYTTAALGAHIVGTDRDDIRIDRTFEYTGGDKPDEAVDDDENTLTVTTRCPDRFAVGHPTCVAHYEIEVPRGTVVRAGSRFGDLTVSGTRAATELRSHYGDVGVIVADDGLGYAVDAVSTTGHAAVDVQQDVTGIPVRLRSEDGSVTVTTAR